MTTAKEIKELLDNARIDDYLKELYIITLAKARTTLSDVDFEEILTKVKKKIAQKEKELN